MARVGFVGTGEIAASMVRALAGQGHAISVSERNAAIAAELAAEMPEVMVRPNADVVAESDIVVLCLLAKVGRQVLGDLPWRTDQAVISVMVDMPLDDLAALCAPARDIAVTIPLPFIPQGGCPLPVYPDSAALRVLFGDRNLVLPVDSEMAVNAHFGVAGLCAPIMELMATASDWLGGLTGDPVAAETYVGALFRGYLSPDGSGRYFAAQLDALSTEGGLNETMRRRMQAIGAPGELRAGMDGLRARLGLPEA